MHEAGRATPTTLSARLRRKAVGLAAAAVALPTALALALPATAAAAPAPAPAQVSADAVPTIKSVQWVTDRQVALTITSVAMKTDVTVGILLPRTWNSAAGTGKKYPSLVLLDGFRVPDTSSDWFNMTDIETFFKGADALVVTAYGGQGSFYANWKTTDPAAGVQGTQKWSDFYNKELPQVLQQSFRADGTKQAVAGLSMGGTAAFQYAFQNPGQYKAAASFSGYLNTTSPFYPQILQYSISNNTPFNPNNLWGDPATDPLWPANNPFDNAEKLAGTYLYASAGDGAAGFADVPGLFGLSANYTGSFLEILARYDSVSTTDKLKSLNIPVDTDYYVGGTHSWPYWERELKTAWPNIAKALGLDANGTAGSDNCNSNNQFGAIAGAQGLDVCTTGIYNVPGGVAQDFKNGRAFQTTNGPVGSLKGVIGAKYQSLGGTGGKATNPLATAPANVNNLPLGLPIGPEKALTGGAVNDFALNGTHIYWTPTTGAQEVGGAIWAKWGTVGFEGGQLGYPTTDESIPNGKPDARYNGFQGGQILFTGSGTYVVKGAILAAWIANGGGTAGPYGLPTSDETPINNGTAVRQTFQGGAYTFIFATGQLIPA